MCVFYKISTLDVPLRWTTKTQAEIGNHEWEIPSLLDVIGLVVKINTGLNWNRCLLMSETFPS